jgi:hypothetical protein
MSKLSINKKRRTNESGIALYMAITIASALVLVAFAVVSLALRQISISSAGRDSQAALYAADSGTECALYWDAKTTGGSAFASSSPVQIACNVDSNNKINPTPNTFGPWSPTNATSTFTVTFLPDPYCAIVTVYKGNVGSGPVVTQIQSKGYNTCDPTNTHRVERAIQVNY